MAKNRRENGLERVFGAKLAAEPCFSAPVAYFYSRRALGEGFWEPKMGRGRPVTASCAAGGAQGTLRKRLQKRSWALLAPP